MKKPIKPSKAGKANVKIGKRLKQPISNAQSAQKQAQPNAIVSPQQQAPLVSNEKRYPFGSFIIIGAILIAAAFFVFSGLFAQDGQKERIVISGLPPDIAEKAALAQKNAGEDLPKTTAQPANQGVPANNTLSEPPKTVNPSPISKEVTIDFLYADWCGYCSKMKPIVEKVASEMPQDRFEVRYWNEKGRGANSTVAGIYALYRQQGYFKGYPSFVANGNSSAVGAQSEPDFRAWVCSHFSPPKPEACGAN